MSPPAWRRWDGGGPEVHVHASADLPQTPIRHGLVDRFRIWTFPVVIGSGKRLWGDGAVPAALQLVASRVSATGVVIATHDPAGDVAPGTSALE